MGRDVQAVVLWHYLRAHLGMELVNSGPDAAISWCWGHARGFGFCREVEAEAPSEANVRV